MDTVGIRERLATSTHYLRYFIFGGYVAFLTQIPNFLKSSLTMRHIALLGIGTSFLSWAMDLRNYLKYRRLANEEGFPIITLLLGAFYWGWLIWFSWLPTSPYNTTRYNTPPSINSTAPNSAAPK